MNYGPKIVTNGLVLALDAADKKSYSGSGSVWNDLSGNNNNGTLTPAIAGPTFNSGNGGYFIFDGTDDYVSMASNLSLSTSTGFSYCTWLKIVNPQPNVSAWNYFYAQGNFEIGNFYDGSIATWFIFKDNSVPIDVYTNDVTISWAYIVFGTNSSRQPYIHSYTSSGYNFFSSATAMSSVTLNFSTIFRGTGPGGTRYMRGNCAAVQAYNRKLTDAEVTQNFNATKGRFGI